MSAISEISQTDAECDAMLRQYPLLLSPKEHTLPDAERNAIIRRKMLENRDTVLKAREATKAALLADFVSMYLG
jgi:hypothetical protein